MALYGTFLAVPVILLSCSKGKHHHYLIPALTPCAFWAAEGMPWWGAAAARLGRRRGRWLLAPAGVGIVAVVAWRLAGVASPALAMEIGAAGAVAWLGMIAVMEICVRRRFRSCCLQRCSS